MNKVWISSLSTALGLSFACLSAEAKVVGQFNGNGSFADVVSYDDNGKSGLSVSESRSGGSVSVYLSYNSSSCDPVSGICRGITAFGPIPKGDFNTSAKGASLATNTSANANFSSVKWTYNYNTGDYSETPLSLGVINVDWKSNGISSYKSIGTSTSTNLNITVKSTGQTSWSDASAIGTLGGAPLSGAYARFGSNSNNEITIERK
jgi:hypothetical protein